MPDQDGQNWSVEFLNEEVLTEFEALPLDMQAKFFRLCDLVREFGLPAVRDPYVKQVEGKIYEFRMTGRDGISRSLFVTRRPKRIVVLRSFVKKSQKIPKRELSIAKQRETLAR
jgi:phage-related protein